MVYLITVVPLINGWIKNTFIETALMSMSREHTRSMRVLIIISSSSSQTSGRIIIHMMAGGGMILFLSSIMKGLRSLRSIFFLSEENGFQLLIM